MTKADLARLREEARSTSYRALARKYGLTLATVRAIVCDERVEALVLAGQPEELAPYTCTLPPEELHGLMLTTPQAKLLAKLGRVDLAEEQAKASVQLFNWMLDSPDGEPASRLPEVQGVMAAMATGALLDVARDSTDPKARTKAAEILLQSAGNLKAEPTNIQVLNILQAPAPQGPAIVFPGDEVLDVPPHTGEDGGKE